jgi:hypothetical protein
MCQNKVLIQLRKYLSLAARYELSMSAILQSGGLAQWLGRDRQSFPRARQPRLRWLAGKCSLPCIKTACGVRSGRYADVILRSPGQRCAPPRSILGTSLQPRRRPAKPTQNSYLALLTFALIPGTRKSPSITITPPHHRNLHVRTNTSLDTSEQQLYISTKPTRKSTQ